ncbi:hypothetical protein [Salinimicrobium sp. HB62]|uniref:hypothetical protein n=1 Tax=Salinimicrobium sp. HB62 TaxID=3077781 RepID=UPI002D76BCAC|nr:hypothetical protein [Salinimicrobium sp. HB62]
MKILFTILTLFCLFLSSEAKGQAAEKSLLAKGLSETSLGERIYLHYNTSLLFPGEYFLYSVYSLKNDSGEASQFSKIAYVEMIGEGNETIFSQKVKLENGRGSADFFIPTDTPSGTYKLVAYTNWMKNFENAFFEGDLVVINPYQGNQKKLLDSSADSGISSTLFSGTTVAEKEQRDAVELKLNNHKFTNREQVRIELNSKDADAAAGRYSLSVRKVGGLPAPQKSAPAKVLEKRFEANQMNSSQEVFLPELRGQLVSGSVLSANAAAVENVKVALSIPSNKGFAQIAVTNQNGQFFFNLDRELRDEDGVLEILGETGREMEIRIETNEGLAMTSFDFPDYFITPDMENEIVERSLYNQIENAYFSVKPDTLAPVQEEVTFPESIVETYDLDDYTRFKGVPETFVEIIKSAWVRKEGRDKRVFEVRGLIGHLAMRLKPLVMVDGLLLQDHSALINYDSRRIQTIKIIRDKIYLGPEIYQGAILVETIDGDFPEQFQPSNSLKIDLEHPEIAKKYFQQVYNEENRNNRIPDYRYQLLWKPHLPSFRTEEEISFFTSDVDGAFEVVLEGFTASGTPVFIHQIFTVE